jgi:hypothetical protein
MSAEHSGRAMTKPDKSCQPGLSGPVPSFNRVDNAPHVSSLASGPERLPPTATDCHRLPPTATDCQTQRQPVKSRGWHASKNMPFCANPGSHFRTKNRWNFNPGNQMRKRVVSDEVGTVCQPASTDKGQSATSNQAETLTNPDNSCQPGLSRPVSGFQRLTRTATGCQDSEVDSLLTPTDKT